MVACHLKEDVENRDHAHKRVSLNIIFTITD